MHIVLKRSLLLLISLVATPLSAAEAPARLISVNGSLTEIVYQLGAQDQLVGVDTTSQYPEAATHLPQVGYQRQLSAEGILSLNPQQILATSEAGPPTVLEQIQASGVKILSVPVEYSAEGVLAKIELVAKATGKQTEGAALSAQFKQAMQAVADDRPSGVAAPGVVFFLNMGNGSPMAAGRETAAHAMIELAGGRNVFADSHSSYKPVSAEAMIAAKPDIILLSEDSLEALGGIEGALKVPGMRLTPAGENKRIITLDGLHLLGFGTRLPQAVQALTQQFYSTP